MWENLFIALHLVIAAIFIILVNRQENEGADASNPAKLHFWYVNILQFTFGGLLSAYLVLYFRSGSLAASWPFFLILAVAFYANERLKKHYERITFQVSLFFLSIFSFSIFILPVIFHSIGRDIFLLSGLVSLIALWAFVKLLEFFSFEKFYKSRRLLILIISGMFVGINVLYFTNLIPPIPLSLKEGAIYHSIIKDAHGLYIVTGEREEPLRYFITYDTVRIREGEPLYAYSAVFSPARLNTDIVHVWQYKKSDGEWVTRSRIHLFLVGGRENGFRTYSMSSSLHEGKWRVNVENPQGQTLGTIRFEVVRGETDLVTFVKN